MAPRPILRTQIADPNQPLTNPLPFTSCSQSQLLQHTSPHVHFPPTPWLTRTAVTHSPNTYDRAPIAVLPNHCELPERGCRVYDDVSDNDSGNDGGKGNGHDVYLETDGAKSNCHSGKSDRQSASEKIESYFLFEACASEEEGTDQHRASISVGACGSGDRHDVVAKTCSVAQGLLPFSSFSLSPSSSSSSSSSLSSSDENDVFLSPPLQGQSTSQEQEQVPWQANSNTQGAQGLPFAPSSEVAMLKKRPPMKKRSTGRLKNNSVRLACACFSINTSAFSDPALEGCLGGF
ncbi:hypothetical protein AX17_003212 [Amanita inopinata Kibby_2008]|nr:hypothetical protein AX17_003212 [Amanita inopinata Kibby_2008]